MSFCVIARYNAFDKHYRNSVHKNSYKVFWQEMPNADQLLASYFDLPTPTAKV